MKDKILFDIKAWLIAAALIPLGVSASSWQEKLTVSSILWLILLLLFYPHKWLINKYLKKKKLWKYALGLIATIVLSTLVFMFILKQIGDRHSNDFLYLSITITLFIFLSTAVSYGYKGIILQWQFEKIKRQQVEAELKLLQSQVNPHFLFNTLNNIYAQNLENHAEANEMVLQLADLMRYQIESAKKNAVSIQDEIEFIENYLALEKKRLTARIKTSFTVEMAEELSLKIPPMLFIPFIENAYKHGISAEGDCFIHIYLGIKSDLISFRMDNSISSKKQNIKSTNTGLANIKKRLALLFPEKHQLNITSDNQIYHVQLDIKI
jgi:two-component system, LytTR family, sensor kinase